VSPFHLAPPQLPHGFEFIKEDRFINVFLLKEIVGVGVGVIDFDFSTSNTSDFGFRPADIL
jgi:hypothetical protein